MSKVYVQGYVELWCGFSLAGDPEVMYSAIGLVNTADWNEASFATADVNDLMDLVYDCFWNFVPSAYVMNQSFALVGTGASSTDDAPPLKIAATLSSRTGIHPGATDSLPQNCAWLVRKNVPVGKPGRMFIPGVDETDVSNTGVIGGAELADRQTDLDALQTNLEAWTIGGATGVLAFMSKNRAPLAGWSPKQIQSLSLDNRIGTQRRRLRR